MNLTHYRGEGQESALFWMEKAASLKSKMAQKVLSFIELFFGKEEKEESFDTTINEWFEEAENSQNKINDQDLKDQQFSKNKLTEATSVNKENRLPEKQEQIRKLKKHQLNEKGRRENLRALADLKNKKTEDLKSAPKSLEHNTQRVASAILSGKCQDIGKEEIKKLFKDPYFQGQVHVCDNAKGGLVVVVHHKKKGVHTSAGCHETHGQEKFTGKLHP